MFGRKPDGQKSPRQMDLVRLAMPRRVYTQSHADYVVETFAEILGGAHVASRLSDRMGAIGAPALCGAIQTTWARLTPGGRRPGPRPSGRLLQCRRASAPPSLNSVTNSLAVHSAVHRRSAGSRFRDDEASVIELQSGLEGTSRVAHADFGDPAPAAAPSPAGRLFSLAAFSASTRTSAPSQQGVQVEGFVDHLGAGRQLGSRVGQG